jgi:hypothetical protein
MTRTRRTTITALAAALACGLLVASPVAGIASAVPSRAAAKPAAHPVGFFVTGAGQAVTGTAQSALVHDGNGGNHVVTVRQDLGVSGDRGHIVYRTRQFGAKAWTRTEIPGLRRLVGLRLQALISSDGDRVIVVIYQCNGVYVTQTSVTGTRLPTPTLVRGARSCAHPRSAPAASAPPIAQAAVGVDGWNIGVLLEAPYLYSPPHLPFMFYGDFDTAFNAHDEPIPPTDGFVPLLMTLDQPTGKIVVIGKGMSGRDQAIFETTGYNGVRFDGGVWTTPVKIASLDSPSRDYTVESVTARGAKIWVGLLKPHTASSPANAPTLFLAHTTGSRWFSPAQMSHTTGQDTALRLAFNNTTGTLHTAFTRSNPAAPVTNSGIMAESLLNGTWQTPRFLTHWIHDYTQQLDVTASGHIVIGYNQR